MAAAMYQALSRLYSVYCQKALFISVSSYFYENRIVTRNFCVSTHHYYCSLEIYKFHILLIGSSFDWVIFISHIKLLIVFTLFTNTDFIRMLFHQLVTFSINLTALLITI